MKMTPEQFAFWLQGYVELTGGNIPTQEQWDSIVEHLGLLFNKVTTPVAKKEPAKKILTEEVSPTPADPEKDAPKKEPTVDDWYDIIKKQMDDYDRIKKETQPWINPGIPYDYPPFISPQFPSPPFGPSPNWPNVFPGGGDWIDPNHPTIYC